MGRSSCISGTCQSLRVARCALLQRVIELAELREGVVQQLQSMESIKMQMTEQKLTEQTRLTADLDVRLQAACASLDCSAGNVLL